MSARVSIRSAKEICSFDSIKHYDSANANHNRVILRDTKWGGGYQVEVIGRDQITWWRRLLSIFDVGLLAHTTIHLKEVARKLAQSNLSSMPADEPTKLATQKLALKALRKKNHLALHAHAYVSQEHALTLNATTHVLAACDCGEIVERLDGEVVEVFKKRRHWTQTFQRDFKVHLNSLTTLGDVKKQLRLQEGELLLSQRDSGIGRDFDDALTGVTCSSGEDTMLLNTREALELLGAWTLQDSIDPCCPYNGSGVGITSALI